MSLMLSVAAKAQGDIKLNYDDFRSWMKQSVVNGYTFVDSEQENGVYNASFMQLNKLIGVKLLPSSKFDEYRLIKGYDGAQPYDFKGSKTVFVNGTASSLLYIHSSKLNATFVISTSYCKLDKQTMEKIAMELGLGAKF